MLVTGRTGGVCGRRSAMPALGRTSGAIFARTDASGWNGGHTGPAPATGTAHCPGETCPTEVARSVSLDRSGIGPKGAVAMDGPAGCDCSQFTVTSVGMAGAAPGPLDGREGGATVDGDGSAPDERACMKPVMTAARSGCSNTAVATSSYDSPTNGRGS